MNWQRGLIRAIDAGFMVKVNTVYMPAINAVEIPLIAWFAGAKGADTHSIMPLISRAEMASLQRPDRRMVWRMRAECGLHIEQMTHCGRSRTGDFGVPGKDGNMEFEALNCRIGEWHCQASA